MLLGSMALRDLRLEASLESSCEALSDSKLDQLGVDHWVEASTVRTIIQSITTDTILTNWNCFCLFGFVETLEETMLDRLCVDNHVEPVKGFPQDVPQEGSATVSRSDRLYMT